MKHVRYVLHLKLATDRFKCASARVSLIGTEIIGALSNRVISDDLTDV